MSFLQGTLGQPGTSGRNGRDVSNTNMISNPAIYLYIFWAAVSENCVSPDLQMLRCNESWVISRVYFIVLIPEYSQTTSSYISDRHFAEWEDLNSFRTTNQSYWDLDHADCVLAREPQTYFRSSLLFLRPEIRLRFAGYLCSRPCLSSYDRIISRCS